MGSGIAGNAAAYMLRDHFEVRVRRNPIIERYVEICLFVLKIESARCKCSCSFWYVVFTVLYLGKLH